ncbi:MAG: hypothetical protein M3220_08370 [Chloroflexota bacterium]|nr:hypothetical protein [Chloroflexota bacterium]
MRHNLPVPYPTNEDELLQWIDPASWSTPGRDWPEIEGHLGKNVWHRVVLERLAATRDDEMAQIRAAWEAEDLLPPWHNLVDLSRWGV